MVSIPKIARACGGQPVALRVAVCALLGMALATILPAPARAYVPSLEDLYRQIAARKPGLTRLVLETRSEVFDPLGRFTPSPSEPLSADAPPPEAAGRSYRTKVYWIRDRFLGVEVFSTGGQRLHVYLREGAGAVQGSLDPARPFHERDVLPVYLPFLVGDPVWIQQAVAMWGVVPKQVALVRGPKYEMAYRLEDGPGRALWLRPETLTVTRLDTALAGGDTPGRLTFEFGEFIELEGSPPEGNYLRYPITVNVLLDGQLIRRTHLLNFEADPSVQGFPITRLRQDADRIQARQAADVSGTMPGGRP